MMTMDKVTRLRNEARASMRHAMMLERETRLLSKAGYFVAGRPRGDEVGRRIYEFVQKEMAALPPFTDAEVEAELRR